MNAFQSTISYPPADGAGGARVRRSRRPWARQHAEWLLACHVAFSIYRLTFKALRAPLTLLLLMLEKQQRNKATQRTQVPGRKPRRKNAARCSNACRGAVGSAEGLRRRCTGSLSTACVGSASGRRRRRCALSSSTASWCLWKAARSSLEASIFAKGLLKACFFWEGGSIGGVLSLGPSVTNLAQNAVKFTA